MTGSPSWTRLELLPPVRRRRSERCSRRLVNLRPRDFCHGTAGTLVLAESYHLTGFDGIERMERRWRQKRQVRKAVGGGAQNEDRNPSTIWILLIGNLLVGGDQDLKIGSFTAASNAILQACQLRVRRRWAVMFSEREQQLLVNALILEDFHLESGASDSCETKFLAFLQDLDGKLSADRGKALQKVIKRFTVLDVVEQRLHGDTGPAKYRFPMHHFGIACDDFLHVPLSLTSRH